MLKKEPGQFLAEFAEAEKKKEEEKQQKEAAAAAEAEKVVDELRNL